ncbi:MAG: hypothetical protein ABIH76_01180 [Candidatus Bathyarchaeota archaeon]
MKAAKLLLLAYRSYKKGLIPIAEKIFAEAMADETAPDLMESLYKLEAENPKSQEELLRGLPGEGISEPKKETEDKLLNDLPGEDINAPKKESEESLVKDLPSEELNAPKKETEKNLVKDLPGEELNEPKKINNIDKPKELTESGALADILNATQIAQLKAIANIIASKNASELAEKILTLILKK